MDVTGKLVVASVSGGKDSTALSLWLTEQGIEHRRVHMLTGWDNPITLEYLRGDCTRALGPIEEIRGDLLMADLVRKKGMFPSRPRRFCTEELKIKPIIRYIEGLQDAGHEVVNAIGIRAAESEARSKLGEWEWQEAYDSWVWRPLIRWTEQDVIDIHTRHGVRPNPLYLQGATRVGCWPFDDVPDPECMLFLGGSTAWKLAAIEPWCKRFPGRVHVARVNGWKRLVKCYRAGAVSVDGTGWFKNGGGRRGRGGQIADLKKFLRETVGDR